jgi:hypothetical protein
MRRIAFILDLVLLAVVFAAWGVSYRWEARGQFSDAQGQPFLVGIERDC